MWVKLTVLVFIYVPRGVQTLPWIRQPNSTPNTPVLSPDIENCIKFDLSQVEELKNYLLNNEHFDGVTDMSGISFGLLEEDWRRLQLLEDRLPKGSVLQSKLVYVFRILIIALYQSYKPNSTLTTLKSPVPNCGHTYMKEISQGVKNSSSKFTSNNNTYPNPDETEYYVEVNNTAISSGNCSTFTTEQTSTIVKDDVDNVAAESGNIGTAVFNSETMASLAKTPAYGDLTSNTPYIYDKNGRPTKSKDTEVRHGTKHISSNTLKGSFKTTTESFKTGSSVKTDEGIQTITGYSNIYTLDSHTYKIENDYDYEIIGFKNTEHSKVNDNSLTESSRSKEGTNELTLTTLTITPLIGANSKPVGADFDEQFLNESQSQIVPSISDPSEFNTSSMTDGKLKPVLIFNRTQDGVSTHSWNGSFLDKMETSTNNVVQQTTECNQYKVLDIQLNVRRCKEEKQLSQSSPKQEEMSENTLRRFTVLMPKYVQKHSQTPTPKRLKNVARSKKPYNSVLRPTFKGGCRNNHACVEVQNALYWTKKAHPSVPLKGTTPGPEFDLSPGDDRLYDELTGGDKYSYPWWYSFRRLRKKT